MRIALFLLFVRAFFTNVLAGEKQRKRKNRSLGFWNVACFGVFAQKPFGSVRQRIFCFLPGRQGGVTRPKTLFVAGSWHKTSLVV